MIRDTQQSGGETIIWFIIVQEGNHGPHLGTRFQSFITGDKLHGGVDHERGPVAIDRNGARRTTSKHSTRLIRGLGVITGWFGCRSLPLRVTIYCIYAIIVSLLRPYP